MSFVSNTGLQYYHSKMKTILNGKSNTNHSHDLSAMINALGTGTTTPVDTDYYISQYVGGGASNTTYLRRPVSSLWTYMKGKADTVYQPKGSYAASNHSHPYYKSFNGTSGKTGYIKAITVKVTSSYQNQPMVFFLGQRRIGGACRVNLAFINAGSVATTKVSSFTMAGTSMGVYIVNSADGVFDIYIKKSENYDSVVLYNYWKSDYMSGTSISFSDTMVDTLPTGYVAASWGETVNRSAVSNHVDYSMTVQLNGGGTEGTNKFTFNGSSAKSINITPGSIGAATSGHDHTFMTNAEIDALF